MSSRLLWRLIIALLAVPALLRFEPVLAFDRVLGKNFADPGALVTSEGVFLYATRGNGKNFQIARVHGQGAVEWLDRDAMPQLPSWVDASQPKTWAPYVIESSGRYLMYYTARYRDGGRQCIGVAGAATPQGPFRDERTLPLVCPLAEGGAIDPAVFHDGRTPYLLWKNDGNCCRLPTRLYAQQLTADGMGLASMPVQLLINDREDEEGVIEAPELINFDGRLYLIYSSGRFGLDGYRIDHAICDSPIGPCRKEGALLTSGERSGLLLIGPGSASLVPRHGHADLYFHGWRDARARASGERWLYRGRLAIEGGRLTLQ